LYHLVDDKTHYLVRLPDDHLVRLANTKQSLRIKNRIKIVFQHVLLAVGVISSLLRLVVSAFAVDFDI
jgi:hypothetical protein